MGNVDPIEGFLSPEEHMQEYMEFFSLLQQASREGKGLLSEERMNLLEERERKTEVFLPAIYLRRCYKMTMTEYWTMMFAFCCELEEGLCEDCRARYGGHWPNPQYIIQIFSSVLPIGFPDIAELAGMGAALKDILALGPEESMEEQGGFLRRPLRLTSTAFYFLLTGGLPKEEWYIVFPEEGEEEKLRSETLLPLHEKEYGELCGYLGAGQSLRILLCGDRGSGGRTLLCRVFLELGASAVFVKTEYLLSAAPSSLFHMRQTFRLILKLLNPIIILEPAEASSDTSRRGEWERQCGWIFADCGGRNICFLARTSAQSHLAEEYMDIKISLTEELNFEQKRQALDMWVAPEERREWQDELLGNLWLNIGGLERGKKEIAMLAHIGKRSLAEREIWEAVARKKQAESEYGRIIKEGYQPEDIILSPGCEKQLSTIIRIAKTWRKGKGAKGLQVLFHGESGTGKTMAASVVAGQLGLTLFKVDLSRVFDKYIGETEKHMDEIFRVAEQNHYLLFFDEADSLFAKRTAVKDSHDRYANVSTAHLLQRMEEYDGMMILATNLKDSFDDAYVRRIRFVVKFGKLQREGRERLWRKVLEGEPPVGRDVDYGALAEAAEFVPARIAAAAEAAKLLAACDKSDTVAKEHLREALELEAGKDDMVIKGF